MNTLVEIKKSIHYKNIPAGYNKSKLSKVQLLELIKQLQTNVNHSVKTHKKKHSVKKNVESKSVINDIYNYVSSIDNDNIKLLRNKEIIQWLFGDMSFLEKKSLKVMKQLEDKWGQNIMMKYKPKDKEYHQWTNCFGEYICEELFTLLGKTVSTPIIKNNFKPDREIEEAILEVKTQTYYTSGTAGEKILGTPFKYSDIPELYGKKLQIICIGNAEKLCREQYGCILSEKTTPSKLKLLKYYKDELKIEYIGITELLKSLLV